MAGARKLDDRDVRRLRWLAEQEGWSHEDLAEEFSVSRQYVGRLVREVQRPSIGGVDLDAVGPGDVRGAVEQFLAGSGLGMTPSDRVLAETARAVASKLDACGQSDSASAAQAVPRLSSELVDVLERLTARIPQPPDSLDQIRMRRNARRLALGQQPVSAGRVNFHDV